MLFISPLIFIIPFIMWAWIAVELKDFNKWKRIVLGGINFLIIAIYAWHTSSMGTALEYKVWDGGAINKLINTVIYEIENKHTDILIKNLRDIKLTHQSKYSEQIDVFCKKIEDEKTKNLNEEIK